MSVLFDDIFDQFWNAMPEMPMNTFFRSYTSEEQEEELRLAIRGGFQEPMIRLLTADQPPAISELLNLPQGTECSAGVYAKVAAPRAGESVLPVLYVGQTARTGADEWGFTIRWKEHQRYWINGHPGM
jgi:hypothetical protein